MNPISSSFGAVVILDALGVSGYDLETSRKFLKTREELLDKQGEYAKAIPGKMEIFTFGDTIIMLFTFPETEEADGLEGFLEPEAEKEIRNSTIKYLPLVGTLVAAFFQNSIKEKILWRGAISVGRYLTDNKTTVIGPAVADAAAWYEKAEWFGVIATPNCGLSLSLIDEIDLQNSKSNLMRMGHFIKYKVPLKDKRVEEMWACAWPLSWIDFAEKNRQKEALLKELQMNTIPFGTEAKYKNSLEFYESCLKSLEESDGEGQ